MNSRNDLGREFKNSIKNLKDNLEKNVMISNRWIKSTE